MFGPYEAERINDAFNNSSQEKGDRNSAFKTEFERQYYINGLSSQKVDEAIFWLEKSENAGITGRDTMLTKLKTMKGDLGKMQTQVRSETSQVMFDMNNPIKIDRTNFGDLITTRKYNGHNMPNGGGYFQENPTVKGISVIWGENKTVIHSIVIHGKQYIREPDGWFKSSTDQKILVELEGDNIYINRKVAAPQNADPVMAKPLESGGDLNDFQDKMKSVKFTINGKDGTVNKIDKVGNELMVQLDNASITVYFEKKDGGYIVAPKSTANYTVIDTPPSSGNTRTIALTAKDSAVLSKVSTQGDNRNDGDRGGSATKPPAKETVKHVRSANEITGANSTYIAKNRGAIDEAVNKTTDPGKKTTIIGYINHPTKENIIKLQDEIGAGKDGDFRGKTLSSLKTWAGIDVPPATPAGPNIPAESAPVLTGISPELLNPGADKSTLDTALKAAGYTIVGQVDNPLDDGEVENIYKKIDGTKRTLVHVVTKIPPKFPISS